MLEDDNFPVNLYFPRFEKLPKDLAIASQDPEMIRLFLNCPRIDWLKRSELNFEDLDRFRIKYDGIFKKEQKTSGIKLGLFRYLDPWFERVRPEEANLIYDKIFEALRRVPEEQLEMLIFKTFESRIAFAKAIEFCKDINMTAEDGKTVLHFLCQSEFDLDEQIRLAVMKGANVNAKDENGCTPLMIAMEKERINICSFLIENGADLEAVDGEGRIAYDYIPKSLYRRGFDEKFGKFVERFGLSESIFRNLFKKKVTLGDMRKIFDKYPAYKAIFLENVAENASFLCFDDCFTSTFPGLLPENGLDYLKLSIQNNNYRFIDRSFYPFLTELLNEHVHELFEMALAYKRPNWISALIKLNSACANFPVNGLPPLFCTTNGECLIALLNNGANPWMTVDGCQFFQRPDFVLDDSARNLIEHLQKLEIDVFAPSPLTGKTVFQNSKGVQFTFPRFYFEEPWYLVDCSKMTSSLMAHMMVYESDYMEPVDDKGNTVLHYIAMKLLRTEKDEFTIFSVESLNKNKAGLTALDIVIRSENCAEELVKMFALDSLKEIRLAEAAYDDYHGAGAFDSQILAQFGGFLYFQWNRHGHEDTIEYFLHEKQISRERVSIALRTKLNLQKLHYHCAPIIMLHSLNHGINSMDVFAMSDLLRKASAGWIFNKLAETRSDFERIYFELIENLGSSTITSLFKVFDHPQIIRILKFQPVFASKLLKHFFRFCFKKSHVCSMLFFNLTPRVIVERGILCEGTNGWDASMWKILVNECGLKREDFAPIRFKKPDDFYPDRSKLDEEGRFVTFEGMMRTNECSLNGLNCVFGGGDYYDDNYDSDEYSDY